MQTDRIVFARAQQPLQRLRTGAKIVFAVGLEPGDSGPLFYDGSVMLRPQTDASERRQ